VERCAEVLYIYVARKNKSHRRVIVSTLVSCSVRTNIFCMVG
jgi:hypothetical protein